MERIKVTMSENPPPEKPIDGDEPLKTLANLVGEYGIAAVLRDLGQIMQLREKHRDDWIAKLRGSGMIPPNPTS